MQALFEILHPLCSLDFLFIHPPICLRPYSNYAEKFITFVKCQIGRNVISDRSDRYKSGLMNKLEYYFKKQPDLSFLSPRNNRILEKTHVAGSFYLINAKVIINFFHLIVAQTLGKISSCVRP